MYLSKIEVSITKTILIVFFSYVILIQNLSKTSEAETYYEKSLLPIERSQNFVEFSKDMKVTNEDGIYELNGQLESKYFFKLKFSNSKKNYISNLDKSSPNVKIEAGLLDDNYNINMLKIKYQSLDKRSFYCFETQTYVVGINSYNCRVSGKIFYPSINENYTINLSGSEISISSEANKTYSGWNSKTNFGFGTTLSFLERKTIFSSGFNSLNEDASKLSLVSDKWLENHIYSNIFYVRNIKNNLSAGLGLSAYYKIFDLDKKDISRKKFNIKLNAQVTKKTSGNFYFGLGGYISKNYSGFNNLQYHVTLPNENKSYGLAYAKIGFLRPSLKFKKTLQKNLNHQPDELKSFNISQKFQSISLKKNIKQKSSIIENNPTYSKKEKKQKEESLINFALAYAKLYDK